MTTPMLEKCARALCERPDEPGEGWAWVLLEEPSHDSFRADARAVLTALLEPDEGMVEAMQESFPHYALDQDFRATFTAAIQHILKGEGNV